MKASNNWSANDKERVRRRMLEERRRKEREERERRIWREALPSTRSRRNDERLAVVLAVAIFVAAIAYFLLTSGAY